MRRAFSCLSAIVLGLTVLSGVAAGAPTVKMKAEAVPIPGFPHTGNIYGAGSAIKVELNIEGSEYGGFPPPLIGVAFYFPTGTRLHPAGFPTCPRGDLEPAGQGPSACPKGSKAGPVGSVLGIVAFGGTRVPEEGTIESFYAPGGGVEFFTAGHSPVSLEILSTGHFVNLGGGGGFGPRLISQIPLVETVPGAPDASVEKIVIQGGSAIRKGKEVIYYGRVPKRGQCPKRGFNVKAELTFAGLGGLTQTTVPVDYRAPCPRK